MVLRCLHAEGSADAASREALAARTFTGIAARIDRRGHDGGI
jgi:hypothetical protein